MGCGPSHEDQSPKDKKKKGGRKKGAKGEKGDKDRNAESMENVHSVIPAVANNPLKSVHADGFSKLIGKDKYIAEAGAVVMVMENGTLVVFAPNDEGLTFAYRDNQSTVYVKEFTSEAQLESEKAAAGIEVPWGSFFKSIASDVLKCKAKVNLAGGTVTVTITMTSSKDPKYAKPWAVRLTTVGSSPRDLHRFFLAPLTAMVQARRTAPGENFTKEANFNRIETEAWLARSGVVVLRRECHNKKEALAAPRAKAADIQRAQFQPQFQIGQLQRKLARAKGAQRGGALDAMYEKGGARFFAHLEHSPDHQPVEEPINDTIATALRTAFDSPSTEQPLVARLKNAPTSPLLAKLLQANPRDKILVDGVLKTMQRLDDWDYDVFAMDSTTQNKALVYTTYAILLKLNLVEHFKIDLATLSNFLCAVQAGYHPNPYHNATHAADVAQINYYIMTQGGLVDKCKLSKEELLGGVLAGAIHDYDHPGFNNNFHTRTNAYLSTLYNDRSVLENHHCACVYEILRKPKYNIFANLTDDQKKEVRDTILEMVLSTDMGNHARIFGAFRRRQAELIEGNWTEKDDRRLALSMSIKMADISNCGRPNNLYLNWAKNIASEFYLQGDAEAMAGLSISPFMDRKKAMADFPNGQVSFMKFIVIPMFEAISEFLPKMEFCLQHCNTNRDYWKRYEEL
jgi:hypothetical protein